MNDHRGILSRVMIRRTKREVTDADGAADLPPPAGQYRTFPLAPREREFYDQLSEYLREGYSVAGINQTRTTSQQRAIGFVMATFQKIMSSSPRAIRQASADGCLFCLRASNWVSKRRRSQQQEPRSQEPRRSCEFKMKC